MSQSSNTNNANVILTIHDPSNKKMKRSITVENHQDMEQLISSLVQLQRDFVKVVEEVNVKSLCNSNCCKSGMSLSCIFSCLKRQVSESIEQTPERPAPPKVSNELQSKPE